MAKQEGSEAERQLSEFILKDILLIAGGANLGMNIMLVLDGAGVPAILGGVIGATSIIVGLGMK